MYEFDMTNPDEVKRLQFVIESAVKSVTTHVARLQSEPVDYSHEYGWTGAGNDQLFKPVMKGLHLETTGILKSEQGTGRKTEWLGTTNPNIIVMTEYGSPEGNGKNWQMTERTIGVINNAWLKAEFHLQRDSNFPLGKMMQKSRYERLIRQTVHQCLLPDS